VPPHLTWICEILCEFFGACVDLLLKPIIIIFAQTNFDKSEKNFLRKR